MKRSRLGTKQTESACHALLGTLWWATCRCKWFNGNGALWCVETAFPAGLKAGWSGEQEANETQEYSARLKSQADWRISHKEEPKIRDCTSNTSHRHICMKLAKKVTFYSTWLIRFRKTWGSFVSSVGDPNTVGKEAVYCPTVKLDYWAWVVVARASRSSHLITMEIPPAPEAFTRSGQEWPRDSARVEKGFERLSTN